MKRTRGKRSATWTPIRAVAPARLRSAARTSARRHLELLLQAAQLDVGAPDLRGDRHDDVAQRLFIAADVVAGRLHRAPHPAPEVELPGRVEARAPQVEGLRCPARVGLAESDP